MEAIFEPILQFVLEFFVQIFMEVLAEFGMHCAAEVFEREPKPWMAAIGYVILGALAGLASVLFVPSMIATPGLRVLNLLLAPLFGGAAMTLVGSWRRRREQSLVRLDSFAYGYLFALALALVRFWLAK